MSKLLRLPLTLLAVLGAMLFLPGIAWGDPLTPSAAQCAASPQLEGCAPAVGGGTTTTDSTGGTTADQPKSDPAPDNGGGTTGQQPGGQSTGTPAGSPLVVPFQVPTQAQQGPVVGLDAVTPPPPLDLCTTFPQAPVCSGTNPPTVPLTCDGLAQLLGQSSGCPSSFSCQDLATLLGLTCPAGPPDCQALAALFHLEGCPQPPTSCQEFADLLGIDNCSQIPCLDTSKLPQQARDGLKQLFDGLKNIGIKECPAPPAPESPGKGTYMPPTQPSTDTQPPPPPAAQPAAATTPTTTTTTTQPTGHLAYTGMELGPQLNVAWTLLVLGAGLAILGRRRA